MTAEEFKYQIIKTPDQWNSGLRLRLKLPDQGGISLNPVPVFDQWLLPGGRIQPPGSLVVDPCGQIYLIDTATCRLYRFDPKTEHLDHIRCIGLCGATPRPLQSLPVLLLDKFTLWVLDRDSKRIQAFSLENFQIKYIIENLTRPVDLALHPKKYFYMLDSEARLIYRFDLNGQQLNAFGSPELKNPVQLAVGKQHHLYVLDYGYSGFLLFDAAGNYLGLRGDFTQIATDFQPGALVIDRQGIIYVADRTTQQIHQFDADGSYLGPLPGFAGDVTDLAVDGQGNLFATTEQGLARFSAGQAYSQQPGLYYSPPLDSGIPDCQWHRLALTATLPPKTQLAVYYFSSDDSALKTAFDQILAEPDTSVQQKAARIESIISWSVPVKNPPDMLFQEGKGRYHWLKLALGTLDPEVSPTVHQLKIYYPRLSYLRYLPAIYQEEPASKAFLEKFLSMFETLFYDLEVDIARVFRYFDPQIVPAGFLAWLGSWLNFALEEAWPEATQRQFIAQAMQLYKQKGTPAGISNLIEILTGKPPVIIEHLKNAKPMILGHSIILGLTSLLLQTPIRGFRLGDDAILGRVAIRDEVQTPEDPFLTLAHRFTILLDLSQEDFARYEPGLRRILNEQKPAHTHYHLRNIHNQGIGAHYYIEINSRVADYRPFRVGFEPAIGAGIVVVTGEAGGKVERRSILAKDTILI